MTEPETGQIDSVIVTIVSRKLGLSVDMRCPCHKPVELLGQEIQLLLIDEFGSAIDTLGAIKLSFNNRSIPNGQSLSCLITLPSAYIITDAVTHLFLDLKQRRNAPGTERLRNYMKERNLREVFAGSFLSERVNDGYEVYCVKR